MSASTAVPGHPPVRLVARMALAAVLLTLVVVASSAFMRHTQAGLACADWPACYATATAAEPATTSTAVRVARIAHRLAATGVLALILGVALLAWVQRPAWVRIGSLALAALVVAAGLAALGIATPGSRLPAVTLGNLLGGYLLLALLAAAAASGRANGLRVGVPGASAARGAWRASTSGVAVVVLLLVFGTAALGGLIGAQYALTECPTLRPCLDADLREVVDGAALDPFVPLAVRNGRFVPPPGVAALATAHRGLGAAVAIAALLAAISLRRRRPRLARILALLALATPLLGVGAVAALPSLPLTLLHNASAALLVATLAVMAVPSRATPAGPLRESRRGFITAGAPE